MKKINLVLLIGLILIANIDRTPDNWFNRDTESSSEAENRMVEILPPPAEDDKKPIKQEDDRNGRPSDNQR